MDSVSNLEPRRTNQQPSAEKALRCFVAPLRWVGLTLDQLLSSRVNLSRCALQRLGWVSLSPPIECSSARQLTIWPHQLSAETTLLRDTVPHGARVYSCHDRALEPDHSCH
ncbi:hypothetical protein GN956_G12918 [Arapaima gigas]